MTYYELRRVELLSPRKRKPRRCDVLRWLEREAQENTRVARMVRAAKRLERAMA